MNYYDAIKVKSLLNVLKPDTEYFLRRIARWYSKTFHTPLSDVYDLPIEFILREFYEERYESMEEEDREEELILATETDEQRKARASMGDVEVAGEYELLKMAEEINAKVEKPTAPKPTFNIKDIQSKATEDVAKLGKTLKTINETLKQEMVTDPPELPDIDMKFEDDASFEALLNRDSNIDSTKE